MKRSSVLIVILLALFLPGCVYVHTFQPVTVDMHKTPVTAYEKAGNVKLITWWPFIGNYKLVAWGSAAIGDVAKEQGMQEVYFADLETFSVLRVWNEYTLHVYGK